MQSSKDMPTRNNALSSGSHVHALLDNAGLSASSTHPTLLATTATRVIEPRTIALTDEVRTLHRVSS